MAGSTRKMTVQVVDTPLEITLLPEMGEVVRQAEDRLQRKAAELRMEARWPQTNEQMLATLLLRAEIVIASFAAMEDRMRRAKARVDEMIELLEGSH